MTTYKIALYPGDGIGVDVMDEAEKLLDALAKRRPSVVLERTRFPWGCEHYQKTGELFPPNILEILQPYDAVLLGAIGLPSVLPDHVTLEPLIKLRQGFDQYACVRPAKLLPGVASPLANKTPKDIDMLVIRENSEGEYVADGGRFKVGTPQEVAVQTSLHTRKGVERIIRFAFEQARKRRNRMTLVTKSNALKFSMVLWDEVWTEVRKDYPDVETDKQHVDAAAMNFVRKPEHFDVVVASNLFGDILTDLGAILMGGLGLAPSANINPDRKHPSLFEPVHGSAPDIVGKGIANPIAMFLSVAMMYDWLNLPEDAKEIRTAVESTLAAGVGTPDLGGKLTTGQLADEVIRRLG